MNDSGRMVPAKTRKRWGGEDVIGGGHEFIESLTEVLLGVGGK